MKPFRLLLPAAFLVLLVSCQKSTGTGPHATVTLRDGTSIAGTVTASSPTEIQLAGDDKSPHTISMAQVSSVQYDAPPAAPAAPPATAPPAAAPSDGSAPPAAPPVAAAPIPPDPAHDHHYHPYESAITTTTYDLAIGTQIPVRSEETIDSARAIEGQTYAAEIANNVLDASGAVVIPRGANARIVIRSASRGGKVRGASDLVLDLASVAIEGRQYRLSTVDLVEKGRNGVGANKRTAEFSGGGAAIGAIIGAIAGGGKGAAIGAGSGAGAGAVTQILTKGPAIRVPAESIITFRLDQSLHVTRVE